MITPHFPYLTDDMCNNSSNYTINKQSTKRQLCLCIFSHTSMQLVVHGAYFCTKGKI